MTSSRHGEAADELLADGKWHSLSEIVTRAGKFVPAEAATRRAEAKRVKGTHAHLVETGRHYVMQRLALSRVDRETWQTRVQGGKAEYRRNPKKAAAKPAKKAVAKTTKK